MNLRTLLPLALLVAAAFLLAWLLFRPDPPPPAPEPYPRGKEIVEHKAGVVRVVDIRPGVMGTRFAVEVAAPDVETGRFACRQAFRRIRDLELALSSWKKDSLLLAVNREAPLRPVRVDPETFHLLELAQRYVQSTGGAFDPTVGPLSGLWRTARANRRLPDPAEVEAALERVGYDHVRLTPRTREVGFERAGVALDLGAIAKGYAADVAAWAAVLHGATACRVNAGGDHVVVGVPPWSPGGFDVALRDPRGAEGARLEGAAFTLTHGGVASSGNYERYTEIDGVRYSHILDPETGLPVEGPVVQVTVVAPTGAEADALATALTVMGAEKGLVLAEGLPGVEALFLLREGDGFRRVSTSAFPGVPR